MITANTTDAEIEAIMQQRINAEWPPAMREKALRLGGALLDELNAYFATMGAENAALIAERDAKRTELEELVSSAQQATIESLATNGGMV